MIILDSIFMTIESIKKKYPSFKIKVASIKLLNIIDSEAEDKKLVDLLSTYNVAELDFTLDWEQEKK